MRSTTSTRSIRRRRDDGAVGVEFALLVIPFMVLALGIIQYSVAYNKLQATHAAAREGARAGAIAPGNECTAANAAMATGGSGDVLTGVAAALAAVSPDLLLAARRAAYVHGLAGDLAAERLGPTSVTALDICQSLPAAFQAFASTD